MLIYNSFKDHLEESVKRKFHKISFNLTVILGKLTSICQPLDVAINKSFKDNLCKEWHIWIVNSDSRETLDLVIYVYRLKSLEKRFLIKLL